MKLFVTSTCPDCEVIKNYINRTQAAVEIHDIGTADGLAEWSYIGLEVYTAPVLVEGVDHPFIATSSVAKILNRLEEVYGEKNE